MKNGSLICTTIHYHYYYICYYRHRYRCDENVRLPIGKKLYSPTALVYTARVLCRHNSSGQLHAVSAGLRIKLRTPLRQRTGRCVWHRRPDVSEQMHDASGNM